ncbi:AP-5 complex subunit beta-1 [Linum grandiflorum]
MTDDDKPPPAQPQPLPPPAKPITPQDWELLIDDFQHGGPLFQKWTSSHNNLNLILDHTFSYLLKKDFPHKLPLLLFLEEFSDHFFTDDSHLDRLLDLLRSFVQAPLDGISVTFAIKEQFMLSSTSIFISVDSLARFPPPLTESLVELLLTVINRPNHGVDRQTRAIASECLRELERCYPCLLSSIVGHLWSLCQSERTHACQSYILLFAAVVHSIVDRKLNVSIANTSVPLVPFNVPQAVIGLDSSSDNSSNGSLNFKELRRAMAFLLESPQVLTPCGMMEFLSLIMPVALALELQPSMLKVQFLRMIYSFNPLLWHVVLVMYSQFADAFDGQEEEIVGRLILISKETQHYLVFRLLSLHWCLGFLSRLVVSKGIQKNKSVIEMGKKFYPDLFDPLALKALRLDMLAFSSICLEKSGTEVDGSSVVKLFEIGLASISAFKWLPSSSTETAVAFRSFHKFLIGVSSPNDAYPSESAPAGDSSVLCSLQRMLVDMTLGYPKLVLVIASFVDRLLGCETHRYLGEFQLQTADRCLLPKLKVDYRLVSYFPIFDRIAENKTIPRHGLLDVLIKFMTFLVEKHGPDSGLRSWSRGSTVLCICRTMLMHHSSSRLFLGLSHLLAFTCLYFPDLELRSILSFGDQLLSATPSPLSNSFFSVQSPRHHPEIKKCQNISSYIHLDRMIPLLVKQSWSLSLSPLGINGRKLPDFSEGPRSVESREEDSVGRRTSYVSESTTGSAINSSQETLRVMDAKISEILGTLRKHFSCIPDYRHMPGLKIRITCSLRFDAKTFTSIWGGENSATNRSDVDSDVASLPALYATLLKFSSSAPYGRIPSFRIPFLLGELPRSDPTPDDQPSLDIVPAGEYAGDESFRVPVTVDLEPREPTPGLVDVFLEANTETGQIINGQLEGISVGIEDMFLKAIPPADILEDALPAYYSKLFDALWEACSGSSSIGREVFPLQGGKGNAAITGTRSVKLLEIPARSLIHATELYLAPFVVSVIGDQLVHMVSDGGIIRNIVWKDSVPGSDSPKESRSRDMSAGFGSGPLHLTYTDDDDEDENSECDMIVPTGKVSSSRRNLGTILVLIFLPPKFHLLFQMEVTDLSTLVRIRTDHWPCLAYIDDYLEALFLT